MRAGSLFHILLLLLSIQLCCTAQTVSVSPKADPVFKDFQLSEKIILETDREEYIAGEVIRFACFVYEPVLKRWNDLSRIAYVEFYTAGNIPVRQIKIKLVEGFGAGSIDIPKDLSSGRYYIRAYTNYMKNAGCEGFTYASVIVLNPFREFSRAAPDIPTRNALQQCTLYPEGGQVVIGSGNQIVCAISDDSGRPASCEARVLDENNQVVATFTTNAYGMGSFVLIPSPDHRYRIEASLDSSTIEKEIQAPEHAVALKKMHQNGHEVQIGIHQFQYGGFPMYLELFHSETAVLLKPVNADDSVISLPLGPLPKGIIQFRLCNENNDVLSAMCIYNPPLMEQELQLSMNKNSYDNRELIELGIKGNPNEGLEAPVSISVFLVDELNQQHHAEKDQESFLQSALYPFLSGSPYPAGEVVKDTLFIEQALIAVSSSPSASYNSGPPDYTSLDYLPEIEKDLIVGSVTDDHDNPITTATILQTWVDTTNMMRAAKTNAEGRFIFENEASGVRKIILSLGHNANGHIVLHEEFYPDFLLHAREEFTVRSNSLENIRQQMIYLQINDAYTEQTDHSMEGKPVPFYLNPDRVFLMDDYVSMPTLEEFLFEVVPGIFPSHRNDKTVIRIVNPSMDVPFGDHPLFLVDGMPVFDSDAIAKLKCSDLLSVGVLYEKCFLHDLTFDGILYIRTRTGDASVLAIPEGIYADHFTGIQQSQGNRFTLLPSDDLREPYFRTLLYWNPSVELNANGEGQIEFVTPDNSGNYLVRCGVKRPDGSLVYYYATFTVN